MQSINYEYQKYIPVKHSSEPYQTCKMELFIKTIKFTKRLNLMNSSLRLITEILYDFLTFHPNHWTKIKLSIKDFFSKCDQIRSFLQIWSHLLKKSVMENFIFCAVIILSYMCDRLLKMPQVLKNPGLWMWDGFICKG